MRLWRAVVAAGLAGCSVMSGGVAVAAPQDVRCGARLNRSATLTHDLRCGDNVALTIGGRAVTLDLGGHLIEGALLVTGDGHTVRNGTLTRVVMSDANDTEITGVRLTGALYAEFSTAVRLARLHVVGGGIGLYKVAGLELSGSRFDRGSLSVDVVDSPRVVRNMFVDSRVVLDGAPEVAFGVQVTDNVFLRGGIELRSTLDVVVARNHIVGATAGVRIGPDSSEYQVIDNDIVGGRFGIRIVAGRLDASASLISGNWLRDNAIAGLLLTGEPGPNSTRRITHNLVHANGYHPGPARDSAGRPIDDGIHIDLPAGRTTEVDHNRTSDNADHGIEAARGTVADGGGNVSERDPYGCLGVHCS